MYCFIHEEGYSLCHDFKLVLADPPNRYNADASSPDRVHHSDTFLINIDKQRNRSIELSQHRFEAINCGR